MNFSGVGAGLETVFGRVLEATVLGSILIVLVAVVQWLTGERLGPRWRFALWGIVLVRLLVPVAPESRWSVFNARQWFAEKAPPVVRMQVDPKTLVVPAMVGEAVEVGFSAEVPALTSEGEVQRPFPWKMIAVCVWGVGVVWLVGRLLLGTWWLRRKIRAEVQRSGVESKESDLNEAVELAAVEIGVRRRFRVVETGMVSSPALFGLWRPQLLVPRGFAEKLNAQELRYVLLHELAHLKRWDLITNWLMTVAQAVHWFNPLVWLALREMRMERELACDEMVLRASGSGGEEGRAYGETILRLLEGVKPRRSLPALVGIAEEKHSARKRILQIVDFDARRPRRRALGILLLMVIGVGGLTNAQNRTADRKVETVTQQTVHERTTPAPNDVAGTKLAEKLDELMFPEGSLEGKSLAEAVELLQKAYPAELRDVRFIWRQATNLSAGNLGESVYSVNAVGYIDTPIAESPATELQLTRANLVKTPLERLREDTLKVENRSALSVLELMTRAVDRAVTLEFEGQSKVVFNEQDRSAPSRLINDARLLLEMGRLDEAEVKLQEVLKADQEHRAALYYSRLIEERRVAQENRKREVMVQPEMRLLPSGQRQTEIIPLADRPRNPYARTNRISNTSGDAREFDAREAELLEALKTNPNDSSAVDLLVELRKKRYAAEAGKREVSRRGGRAELVKKLNELAVEYYEVANGVPLHEVIKDIHRLARKLDPEGVGVNFVVSGRLNDPPVEETGTGFEPLSGRPKMPLKVTDYVVQLSPPLRNVTMLGLINAIVEVAEPPKEHAGAPPLRYWVEDYAIVFGQNVREAEPLYTKTFKIDPNTFFEGMKPVVDINQVLQGNAGDRGPRMQQAVRDFFTAAGIDFGTGGQDYFNPQLAVAPPPQKAIFYNDRTGVLMVRATRGEIELIEKALQRMIDAVPEQVMISVDVVEVKSREEFKMLFNPEGSQAVLTTLGFRTMEKNALNGGFEWLKLPRVTTLTGRPARITQEKIVSVDVTCEYRKKDKTFRVRASSNDAKNGKTDPQEAVIFDARQWFCYRRSKVTVLRRREWYLLRRC